MADAPVETRVAQLVLAGSLSLLVAMLLVSGVTLHGASLGSHRIGELLVLVALLGGSWAQRRSSVALRLAAVLAGLAALATAALLGVFDGLTGPAPGAAVLGWTRAFVAAIAAIAALGSAAGLRGRPPAALGALWPLAAAYWSACVIVGQLA